MSKLIRLKKISLLSAVISVFICFIFLYSNIPFPDAEHPTIDLTSFIHNEILIYKTLTELQHLIPIINIPSFQYSSFCLNNYSLFPYRIGMFEKYKEIGTLSFIFKEKVGDQIILSVPEGSNGCIDIDNSKLDNSEIGTGRMILNDQWVFPEVVPDLKSSHLYIWTGPVNMFVIFLLVFSVISFSLITIKHLKDFYSE